MLSPCPLLPAHSLHSPIQKSSIPSISHPHRWSRFQNQWQHKTPMRLGPHIHKTEKVLRLSEILPPFPGTVSSCSAPWFCFPLCGSCHPFSSGSPSPYRCHGSLYPCFFPDSFPLYSFLTSCLQSAQSKQFLHAFHMDIHLHIHMTKAGFHLMALRTSIMVMSPAIPVSAAANG